MDEEILRRLEEEFVRLNAERFGGSIPAHRIRLSKAVYTHGSVNLSKRIIRISFPMCEQHGWESASNTLLHEMTHAFMHMNGLGKGHGRRFWQEFKGRGGARQKYPITPAGWN
ncbi:MAG: SprT-like domain-containing protein, partial [Candidatus Altiarchaeota archaeon]|nr:SprT-like domain-containing protein [Candidatus Altiarchaeota archaeon]